MKTAICLILMLTLPVFVSAQSADLYSRKQVKRLLRGKWESESFLKIDQISKAHSTDTIFVTGDSYKREAQFMRFGRLKARGYDHAGRFQVQKGRYRLHFSNNDTAYISFYYKFDPNMVEAPHLLEEYIGFSIVQLDKQVLILYCELMPGNKGQIVYKRKK